jgi:phospholipid-binding lipoprotein MlaA
VAILLVTLLPLSACVTYPRGWNPAEDGPDPYQSSNRKVFAFNEGLDDWVLDPVAHGWRKITFERLRSSVDKFFVNLGFPRRVVTNLGQGKFVHAGSEVGRFVINSTVGLLGFFDPATHFGMKLYDEDFGQMFGYWGIGTGPYWVLPVFGPSDPRDAVGLVFDTLFDLRTIASFTPVITLAWTGAVQTVNRRAIYDEDIDKARASALDFYVFLRDAYLQRREALVADEDVSEFLSEPEPVSDDLYDVGPSTPPAPPAAKPQGSGPSQTPGQAAPEETPPPATGPQEPLSPEPEASPEVAPE